MLSDRQLLDVMFAAKQNSITTVGGPVHVTIGDRLADVLAADDPCGERRCYRMADRYANDALDSNLSITY